MFKSPKNGSHFIQKIEKDNFFLDADPEFFRIILNWLRLGKITTENPEILNVHTTTNKTFHARIKVLEHFSVYTQYGL